MEQSNSINILKQLIDELKKNLPTSISLPLSQNVDLDRASMLRECMFHRMYELTESAYDCCMHDRLNAAIVLTRAIMETESLFGAYLDKLKHAIRAKEFSEFKSFLIIVLRGSRFPIAKEKFNRPLAINALTFIDQRDKQIPGYRTQYDFLCEFTHPNSAGLNNSFSKINWMENEICFGPNRERLDINFAISPLTKSLEIFIEEYDLSADCLEEWRRDDSNAK